VHVPTTRQPFVPVALAAVIPLYLAIASCCATVQLPADMHATYWFAVPNGEGADVGEGVSVAAAVAVALGDLAAAGGVEELPQAVKSSPAAHTEMKIISPVICFFTGFSPTLMPQCPFT
jgi:hypothetical protein